MLVEQMLEKRSAWILRIWERRPTLTALTTYSVSLSVSSMTALLFNTPPYAASSGMA